MNRLYSFILDQFRPSDQRSGKFGALVPKDSDTTANERGKRGANDEPRSFPFFKLPLELRREVYSYVLIQDKQPLLLTRKTKAQRSIQDRSIAVLITSRRVNAEAYPLFLSVNTFEICGTKYHWQWLRRLDVEGQIAFRKVVCSDLLSKYSPTALRTFTILAACPKLSLTITIHFHQLLLLYRLGTFRYLHGFSRATCSLATAEKGRDLYPYCESHGSRYNWAAYPPPEDSRGNYGRKVVQLLLEIFSSECPKTCRSHKSRTEPHSASTLHIVYGYGCPECPYDWRSASRSNPYCADDIIRSLWP